MKNLFEVVEEYNKDLYMIPQKYRSEGAGKGRNLSGVLYENLITNICITLNLNAKRNDYKKSEVIDGYQLKNLQVDKHIYKDDKLIKMVESKTYLDVCYLKRAVDDMIDLHLSPDVCDKVDYAIFTGQLCLAEDDFSLDMKVMEEFVEWLKN